MNLVQDDPDLFLYFLWISFRNFVNPLHAQNWSKSKKEDTNDETDGFLGEAPVSFGMDSEIDRHGIILPHAYNIPLKLII